MKKTRITDDSLFKYIFGGGNKVSKRLLRFILSIFLDIEVHTVKQLCSNVTTGRNEKQMIADVILYVNNMHFVIIEMQNQKKDDNNDRFTSYESVITMFRNEKGQPYNVGKNYILVFAGYHVRKDKGVHDGIICHRYSDGYIYSDKYIIKIVELVGLSDLAKQPVKTMTKQERCKLFIRYLNNEQFPQYKTLINEIVEYEEDLKMTLAEIFKATNEEDWPHEFLKWKNEEQLRREEEYEKQKERKYKKAELEVKKTRLEMKEMREKKAEALKIKEEAEMKKKEAEMKKKEAELKKLEAEKITKATKQEVQKLTKAMELMSQGMSQEEALRHVENFYTTAV